MCQGSRLGYDSMASILPRLNVWIHPRWVSEHAFDKLRMSDCTFAEFESALER